jgi:hypothetical protein
MNAVLSTFILLAGLAQTSSVAHTYGVSGQENLLAVIQDPMSAQGAGTTTITTADSSFGGPVSDQAQDTVLVVPTPDLPAESLADLTEDLAVMCRIFDKSLPSTRAVTGFGYGGGAGAGGYGGGGGDVFRFVGPQSRRTQGLYLDGYGALFFVHVDYPLVPTEPQETAPATKPKESADSVWSQTVKEMSGQPDEEQQGGRTAVTYDPARVENLKKTLIKSLTHASNVRMRRPQDAITLVVGALDDSRPWGAFGQAGARTSGRRPSSRQWGQPDPDKAPTAARNPASGLLILRVTKADVDALAKGQLTLAQFTDKVQSLWSPTDQATPAAEPAPMTSRSR